MKLSTNRQYVFISPKGELIIQFAKIVTKPHETIETKVWVNVQNYIETKTGKKKISVKNFNKLKLTFLGKL